MQKHENTIVQYSFKMPFKQKTKILTLHLLRAAEILKNKFKSVNAERIRSKRIIVFKKTQIHLKNNIESE